MRKHNVLTRLGGRCREPVPAQRAMRLMLVGLLVLPQSVAPAVITVTGTDSTIAADGVCSLREAITAANTNTASGAMVGECPVGDDLLPSGGDTITLTANVTLTVVDNSYGYSYVGSYFGYVARGLPVISTDVTIAGGGFTIERDVITPAPDFGIFAVSPSGTLSLVDTTVSGGSGGDTTFGGGGIANYGTTTLTNSTVSGNSAPIGGGIFNYHGTTTLINSTVSGNDARFGGGILNLVGEELARLASMTLTNSTVSGNSASYDGGGILNIGTTTLTNSTVSGNSASDYGGGIFNRFGTTTLTNSTVSGNSASTSGGGIYNNNDYYSATTLMINSIVANSLDGGDCSGVTFSDGGNNFSEDGSCPGALIISGVFGVDIDTTLADNGGPTETHALLAGSVAIDAAGNCAVLDAVVLLTDQRGVLRNDGSCDSGSYEFVPVSDDDSSDDDSSDDDSS